MQLKPEGMTMDKARALLKKQGLILDESYGPVTLDGASFIVRELKERASANSRVNCVRSRARARCSRTLIAPTGTPVSLPMSQSESRST